LAESRLPRHKTKVLRKEAGIPGEGFVYLIGMVVTQSDSERRYSFWADTPAQEGQMFEEFLERVERYDDFQVFCYP
jgi:predicted RecB family nuclease